LDNPLCQSPDSCQRMVPHRTPKPICQAFRQNAPDDFGVYEKALNRCLRDRHDLPILYVARCLSLDQVSCQQSQHVSENAANEERYQVPCPFALPTPERPPKMTWQTQSASGLPAYRLAIYPCFLSSEFIYPYKVGVCWGFLGRTKLTYRISLNAHTHSCTLPQLPPRNMLPLPDARVGKGVADVGDQVADQGQEGADHQNAHHHRVIP